MKRTLFFLSAVMLCTALSRAQRLEPVPYGDMEQWVVRFIKESGMIGGQTRELYCLGKSDTIRANKAYDYKHSGSPWSSSNAYARVAGIDKGACTMRPEKREDGGMCCRLDVELQSVKAIGIINVSVIAGGTLFTGRTIEPIRSTDNPNKNIECGVPFTKRPKALVFDYKCRISPEQTMTSTKGGGKPKTIAGHDCAKAFILLIHRWEDADGNIHAIRVGTGMELFEKTVSTWQNGHRLPIYYGDITGEPFYKPYMKLKNDMYAMNSKGKMVNFIEEGWDATKTPTHMIINIAAGSQEPFVGREGNTMWVDNVMLEY